VTGLLSLIREADMPERSVEVCLRAKLVAEFEDLERRLKVVIQDRDGDEFGGSGEATRLARRMEELREEMRQGTAVFWLRSIGPIRSGSLMAEHPPRDGNEDDRRLGYNPETFYPAIIRACCYAIKQDGETLQASDLTDEDWQHLFRRLSYKQFDNLFGAAWLLDHGDVSVPTSPLASLISQRSGEGSKQRAVGESPRDGSTGGNPSGSQPMSTTSKAASAG
jgi:hypothetical protein